MLGAESSIHPWTARLPRPMSSRGVSSFTRRSMNAARVLFLAARRSLDSYTTSRAFPTAGAHARTLHSRLEANDDRGMSEKHFYADVELPFHVWVREGRRWVLREARAPAGGAASPPEDSPTSPGRRPGRQSRRTISR